MIRNTNETTTVADVTVAMILRRPVTIDYERADGSRTVRVVEPFVVQGPDSGVKHPYFRAMDRLTLDYRTFRFDRLYAYRVANASGRFRIPRPDPVPVFPEITGWIDPTDTPAGFAPDGLGAPDDGYDDEWAAWLESQYDPDVTLADRLEDLEV